jgi:hypothetical protein
VRPGAHCEGNSFSMKECAPVLWKDVLQKPKLGCDCRQDDWCERTMGAFWR